MITEQSNMALRKFLKRVGVTSQQQIETAVRQALENQNSGQLPLKMVLTIGEGDKQISHTIEDVLSFEKEQS